MSSILKQLAQGLGESVSDAGLETVLASLDCRLFGMVRAHAASRDRVALLRSLGLVPTHTTTCNYTLQCVVRPCPHACTLLSVRRLLTSSLWCVL
jgi:hypothetical protein